MAYYSDDDKEVHHRTVHTDGACFRNGLDGARAGIGVYWGRNSDLNYWGPVTGKGGFRKFYVEGG